VVDVTVHGDPCRALNRDPAVLDRARPPLIRRGAVDRLAACIGEQSGIPNIAALEVARAEGATLFSTFMESADI
jgi:hypothetical protein